VFESDTRGSDFLEDVEVERSELARVGPVVSDLSLEVKERDLVLSERSRFGNSGRSKELTRGTTSASSSLLRLGGDVLSETANDFGVERLDRLHVSLGDLRLKLDELVELLDLVLNLVELEKG
jgi:hypothetical protein